MKQPILLLTLLLSTIVGYSQEIKFLEYSYSEFFRLIQEEQDSVFVFENAIVTFNPATDEEFKGFFKQRDSIFQSESFPEKVVDKEIQLQNVIFKSRIIESQKYKGEKVTVTEGAFIHFHFLKAVSLVDVYAFNCFNSKFENSFYYENKEICSTDQSLIAGISNSNYFASNEFKNAFFRFNCESENIIVFNNKFDIDNNNRRFSLNFIVNNNRLTSFGKNRINGSRLVYLSQNNCQWVDFRDNNFNTTTQISISNMHGLNRLIVKSNTFEKPVIFDIDKFYPVKYSVEWKQFDNELIADMGLGPYLAKIAYEKNIQFNPFDDQYLKQYIDSIRIADEDAYTGEMGFRGFFYNHYKSIFDNENANAVYVNLKNLETKRLAYLYKNNPTFDTFFTWKINQFLKVFSAYGTKPSRAIIFSLYVILIFALFYLFFPNSWDSHGKHRIIHRYSFFLKYLRRNQGIHEVYLEEKQPELLGYEHFRQMIEESEYEVPRFFRATALPLYKWSLSGTKLTAAVLSRVDVMKGTWQEVPPAHRWWKGLLLIGAFLMALAWDVIIKILNALMLSINTFTTLGFGEIPIKGLPRYLAIVQGFIGWFMLTIFSVSLISQLLN
ncbi:potassium channel family protein [Mangrovibacterium diazotrophicum]|uniref:Ion channel n=1 Tax=Mangrovibacterium diazotrophicum TaxID=1261403 RepID=A0A419W9P0_9BACT|nr:potassium channel family protein [Mangrovibacterium diazotrophicum]RKD92136.1 ion channel [Mangrovibacterium diazotrophicum]